MRRPLGAFEHAQLITEDHAPFNVVTVCAIDGELQREGLRSALDTLQQRHPMLAVHVVGKGRRREFVSDETPTIPLTVIDRETVDDWVGIAEDELGLPIDTSTGPLIRCTLLRGSGHSEIVLTMQHAIMDGSSGAVVVEELLALCGGEGLPPVEKADHLMPAAETFFPSRYTGLGQRLRLAGFVFRLVADEIRFRLATRRCPRPPVDQVGRCRVLSFGLDERTTTALARTARRRRLSVNSVLNAAFLLAVRDKLYGGRDLPMRAFTFPILRSYLKPRMPEDTLGSCWVMLRLTLFPRRGHDVLDLAAHVHDRIHRATKRGDKFAFYATSPHLMSYILNQHSVRMGHTALSFTDHVRFSPSHGRIVLRDLHVFVSNFTHGPEFAAQARVFRHRLCIDAMYLDTDMDRSGAEAIAEQTRKLLVDAIGGMNS